jgi:hypothetical protein
VFTPFHKPPYPYLYGRSVDETTTLPEILSAVHNMFHVSQLKKCHPEMSETPLNDTVPLEEV